MVFSRHPQPTVAGPSGADVNATKEVRFQDLVGLGQLPPIWGVESRDVMEYQQQTIGWFYTTTLELHFGIADWGHCFDGIYFLAFYKLTYRPPSSHPTMYRGTTMYTTSTILQRACQILPGPQLPSLGRRDQCVFLGFLGFLDCWRVICSSQTKALWICQGQLCNTNAVAEAWASAQRPKRNGGLEREVPWWKTKKAKGKAETETSVLFQVLACQDLSNFIEVPFSVGKIVWFS